MTTVRKPAVAGLFYTDDPQELRRSVRALLTAAEERLPADATAPKALIAPHAGHVYSGPVAASAYALLRAARQRIRRVVLFGPAHRYALRGLATHGADAFETPLGRITLDPAVQTVRSLHVLDAAHEQEHSLEVHLPFLQVALEAFTLAPVVVGHAPPEEVAAALRALWGGPETLVVVSTDLSHFHADVVAKRLDAATARAITSLDWEGIGGRQACGYHALRGLLLVAREMGLTIEPLDLRTSADTAGSPERVVGYGAFAVR